MVKIKVHSTQQLYEIGCTSITHYSLKWHSEQFAVLKEKTENNQLTLSHSCSPNTTNKTILHVTSIKWTSVNVSIIMS